MNNIKNKYNNIEILEHSNPRVIHKVTYDIIIENWENVSELKNILIDCFDHLVEYGFIGKGQIDVYKRRKNN
jgi:calcineurin-like phosphoesterase